jgi:hypothetical protein
MRPAETRDNNRRDFSGAVMIIFTSWIFPVSMVPVKLLVLAALGHIFQRVKK